MPTPKEAFDNHPLHGTIEALKNKIGSVRSHTNHAAVEAEINRLEDVLHFVNARLKQTVVSLLGEQLLTNIDNPLKAALNDINAFLQNSNAAHVNQNVRNHLNGALQQTMLLPRATNKKDADSLAKAANDYRETVDQLIADLRKDKDALVSEVRSAQNEAKAFQEQINQLKSEATSEKSRLSQVVDQHQQQFSQSQQERQNKFTENLTKQKENADKITADQKEAFSALIEDLKSKQKESLSNYEKAAQEVIDILEGKRNEASDLVHVIGNIGVTGNYKKIADEEKKTADVLRRVAIGFMVLMVVAVGSIVFASISNGVDWGTAILRMLAGLIFAVPAGYAAAESAKHRRIELRNRRVELELASLDPFLEKLDDEKKGLLRQKLTERYFGQPEQSEADHAVPPTSLVDLLRAAIDALNKKS